MSTTKTLELYRRNRALQEQMGKEYREFAAAEFPPGTKVRWVHTYNRQNEPVYRCGEIAQKSYGQCDYSASVVMKKGGPVHKISWHLLDLVEVDAAKEPS